jgi:hypothetical protein
LGAEGDDEDRDDDEVEEGLHRGKDGWYVVRMVAMRVPGVVGL